MITKLLLSIIILIIRLIVATVMLFIPELNFHELILNGGLLAFTEFLDEAKNFLYFIIGTPFYAIMDIIGTILIWQLFVYPVLLLVRRNLTKTE